jgi:hypothetical protein
MKHKIGDYEWRQLSMWDFAPRDTVQWFKPSVNTLTGKPWNAHYVLRRCYEVVSDTQARWEDVKVGELSDEFIESLK